MAAIMGESLVADASRAIANRDRCNHFTGKYPTCETIPCPSGPVAQSMNDFISFAGFTRV